MSHCARPCSGTAIFCSVSHGTVRHFVPCLRRTTSPRMFGPSRWGGSAVTRDGGVSSSWRCPRHRPPTCGGNQATDRDTARDNRVPDNDRGSPPPHDPPPAAVTSQAITTTHHTPNHPGERKGRTAPRPHPIPPDQGASRAPTGWAVSPTAGPVLALAAPQPGGSAHQQYLRPCQTAGSGGPNGGGESVAQPVAGLDRGEYARHGDRPGQLGRLDYAGSGRKMVGRNSLGVCTSLTQYRLCAALQGGAVGLQYPAVSRARGWPVAQCLVRPIHVGLGWRGWASGTDRDEPGDGGESGGTYGEASGVQGGSAGDREPWRVHEGPGGGDSGEREPEGESEGEAGECAIEAGEGVGWG
jgi:hypothetical protein